LETFFYTARLIGLFNTKTKNMKYDLDWVIEQYNKDSWLRAHGSTGQAAK
jgi:hypothetical protein